MPEAAPREGHAMREYQVISTDDHIIEPPGIFDGRLPKEIDDRPYAAALVRAYNDWLVDEWQAADPERIIGAGILPLWDLQESAGELRRIYERGLKCISLPSHPNGLGVAPFGDPSWEPLWDAMEETGVPAEIHIVSGKADISFLQDAAGSPAEVFVCMAPSSNMQIVANLLFSGILRAHPKLKFISAESGIGWLPYFLERADYTHRKHQFWTGTKIDVTPSDLFRQSIYANFISDKAGIELRELIGVDNLMLGTDYPHTDSSWPDTQRIIKEQMGDIPDGDHDKICWKNAVRVFQLDGS